MPRRQDTTALVRAETQKTFKALTPTIQQLLPKGVPWGRFKMIALNMMLNNPEMLACLEENPDSVFGALVQTAQLGLMPDGLTGEAYLLPFKVKGKKSATLVIGYRGYMVLGRRSGEITSFHAGVVYEDDEFDFAYGLHDDVLRHVPSSASDPGKVTHSYAVARMKDGGAQMVVVVRRDIDRAREVSKASEGPGWTQWFPEMAMKTALRRLARLLPLSSELQTASGLDGASEAGQDVDLSHLVQEHAGITIQQDEEAPTKTDKLKERLEKVDDGKAPDQEELSAAFNDPDDEFVPDPKKRVTPRQMEMIALVKQSGVATEASIHGWRKSAGLNKGDKMNQVQAEALLELCDTGQIAQFEPKGSIGGPDK